MQPSSSTNEGSGDTLPHRASSDAKSQGPPHEKTGVEGQSDFLEGNEFSMLKDIKLALRAIREGWNVPPARRPKIAHRMCDIAESDPNPALAIKATQALVAMDTADTNKYVALDRIYRLDTGQSTENVAAVQYVKGVDQEDV